MHPGEFFAYLMAYYIYYVVIGGISFYFLPTLITLGFNGDYKLVTFLTNLFGGIFVFPWFIALGLAFRKY